MSAARRAPGPVRSALLSTVALVAAAATVLVGAAPASAGPRQVGATTSAAAVGTTLTISGHGYGHGRGMGQWGALGYAVDHGWNAEQILAHYYGDTTTGHVGDPIVRIRLSELQDHAPYLATGVDYPTTTVVLESDTLRVDAGDGPVDVSYHAVRIVRTGPASFGLSFANSCGGPWSGPLPAATTTVEVLPAVADADSAADTLGLCEPGDAGLIRHVQGQVWAVDTGSGGITVNALPVDDYVRAVVPHEESPGWATMGENMAGEYALMAQAVAVRSYALASDNGTYNTCDAVCQTYPGRWLEHDGVTTDLTNRYTDWATGATSGQVRMRDGKIMATEYSASTGGWTAGGVFPAVVDAGDAIAANPNHSWTVSVPRARIEAAFGKGTLTGIDVTQRNGHGDFGGRVLSMRLTFTGGAVTISGSRFRSVAGLKSDWFRLGDACSDPGAPLAPFASVTAMVDQQYADFLGRAPDAGAQSWVDQVVCNGRSGPWVAASLLTSSEARRGLGAVVRLYEGVFPRRPDAGGVLYWRHRVVGGLSLPDLAANLVGSHEFRTAHATQDDATFVDALYRQMLARAPDAGGAAYWTGRLAGGTLRRAGFVLALASSSEYARHWADATLVNETYIAMLRRGADLGGAAYWAGRLRQGLSTASFVAEIYDSAEYARRF